jgi:hydroxyethylthiazole kinase-like sugar kinase family protein
MPNTLTQYATTGEARTARKLVRAILATGCAVSLYDGEEWTVRKSTSERALIDALCTTGEDQLQAVDASNNRLGSFWLIYGNADDGSELIADHSDNDFCTAMAAAAYPDA